MPAAFIFIFVGVLVLVVVLGIFGHLAEKRRREGLIALARRLGFSFNPTKRRGAPHWGEGFELFRRGHQYNMKNHLVGTWNGMPAEVLDYTYYTESTDSKGNTRRSYHTRTVLALELPWVFPGITIKPDSALREFFEFIGGADIDFESDEFNKRFYVWSDDRKFAYDVVHARMMEFLLRTREAMRGVNLQIIGSRAVVFRERKLDADSIQQLLQFAADFHDKIPDYVKKDHARG